MKRLNPDSHASAVTPSGVSTDTTPSSDTCLMSVSYTHLTLPTIPLV